MEVRQGTLQMANPSVRQGTFTDDSTYKIDIYELLKGDLPYEI